MPLGIMDGKLLARSCLETLANNFPSINPRDMKYCN